MDASSNTADIPHSGEGSGEGSNTADIPHSGEGSGEGSNTADIPHSGEGSGEGRNTANIPHSGEGSGERGGERGGESNPVNPFLAQPSAQPSTPAEHAPPQKAQAPLQSLTEEEKAALWRLYTNQVEINENISQQLSQPWDIPLPSLLPRLGSLLRKKLPHDVVEGRTAEVEYALEVLRREGHPASIDLTLSWFATLLNQCYDAFLDFMTHLPDARFLPLLQAYYRRGESDVLQLMRFIADVHGLPYPTLDAPGNTHLGKLRLTCNACQAPYHYAYHRLYINAECLEQRQSLQEKDVWTDQLFWCKRCGGQISFALEAYFLRAIFDALLLLLRFSPNQETPVVSGRLELLAFPTL